MFKTTNLEPEIFKNTNGTFSVKYCEKKMFSKKYFYLCNKEDAISLPFKQTAKRKDCEEAHWNDCRGEWNFEQPLIFESEHQAKIGLSVFLDVQRTKAVKDLALNLARTIQGN